MASRHASKERPVKRKKLWRKNYGNTLRVTELLPNRPGTVIVFWAIWINAHAMDVILVNLNSDPALCLASGKSRSTFLSVEWECCELPCRMHSITLAKELLHLTLHKKCMAFLFWVCLRGASLGCLSVWLWELAKWPLTNQAGPGALPGYLLEAFWWRCGLDTATYLPFSSCCWVLSLG